MYLASLVKQKILKKNGFIQLCKCVFLTILMLLHLILLPFASVRTEIRLANLEIWTVISRFSLTVFYGIVRPPFNMYASKYCPFIWTEKHRLHYTMRIFALAPLKLRLCSVLLSQLGAPAQSSIISPRTKVPHSPFSAPPTPFTLTSPPLTMVTVSPVTINLYTNSCITARVIYQTVVWVF